MPDLVATLMGLARHAGRAALDLALPPVCLTCDAAVDAPGEFCPACHAGTCFIAEPCCNACGVPLPPGMPGGADSFARACPSCRHAPPPWRRARAALRYDAQAKKLVLPLKYHDRVDLADALAPMMLRAGAALLTDADLLVPVPLHRRRLMARRYNQAALLAAALGRLAGCATLPLAMRRLRATQSLGDLSAAARARMVDGAFAVRPAFAARLSGRRILLIDDVLTSGATARACTLALLAAGAAAVDVLVAARVPSPVAADRPGAAASLH